MPEASRTSVIELDDASWCRLTDALYGFEEAWKVAPFPNLQPFVPPVTDPLRTQTLVELVKVDQERRAQSRQPQLLEDYLVDWPELSTEEDAIAELLEAECRTRAALGDTPTAEELHARFPAVSDRVDLARIAAESRPEHSQPHDELATGTLFGRYEIRELVGHGEMATVYRAFDTVLPRDVALKIPRFDPATERNMIDRFLQEAKLAATIQHHPHVCPIFDAGEVDGCDYIAMAFIEGQTLKDWLKGRTLSPRQAAKLALKLARALEAVHAAGVIHRDIKPSNVMIDSHGEPILMDFGLARQANDEQLAGTAGRHSGTPAYMPPEQVHGDAVDVRSDIYSLGVVLYQLLTGRLPFMGNKDEVLTNIMSQVPIPPRHHQPKLDAVLQRICLKAMAKLPADRYQSAKEFADALDHAQSKPQFPRWPLVAASLVLAAAVWHSIANSRREPLNVAGSLREPNAGVADSHQEPSPTLGDNGSSSLTNATQREPQKESKFAHITNAKHKDECPRQPIVLAFDSTGRAKYDGVINESGLYSEERHWFQVRTVRTGWLLVEALTLTTEVNSHLYLFDSAFKELAEDGDAGPASDAQIAIPVRADEIYHIAISDAKGENGPYLLVITQPDELPPTPPFPNRKFPKDSYPNDPSIAHELTFHATGHAFVAGRIDPIGDQDWFAFTAPQTGLLLIKSETPHSSLDTLFQLFRAETNAQVAEGRNRIVFRVTAGERFRLRIKANEPLKDSGFDATGNYVLRLRQLEDQ